MAAISLDSINATPSFNHEIRPTPEERAAAIEVVRRFAPVVDYDFNLGIPHYNAIFQFPLSDKSTVLRIPAGNVDIPNQELRKALQVIYTEIGAKRHHEFEEKKRWDISTHVRKYSPQDLAKRVSPEAPLFVPLSRHEQEEFDIHDLGGVKGENPMAYYICLDPEGRLIGHFRMIEPSTSLMQNGIDIRGIDFTEARLVDELISVLDQSGLPALSYFLREVQRVDARLPANNRQLKPETLYWLVSHLGYLIEPSRKVGYSEHESGTGLFRMLRRVNAAVAKAALFTQTPFLVLEVDQSEWQMYKMARIPLYEIASLAAHKDTTHLVVIDLTEISLMFGLLEKGELDEKKLPIDAIRLVGEGFFNKLRRFFIDRGVAGVLGAAHLRHGNSDKPQRHFVVPPTVLARDPNTAKYGILGHTPAKKIA